MRRAQVRRRTLRETGAVLSVNGMTGHVIVQAGGGAVTSVAGRTGAVTLVKGDVGLAQVDNTADADKPVSTAQQSALNGKETAGAVAAHELALPHITLAQAAAVAPVQSVAGRTGAVTLVKGDVGLGNVDNTSDASKPVSTAQQTALDAKQSTSQKGQANGYAGLGADGLVPLSQLPALGGGAWTTIKKSADTTRTNNTLSNDPDLQFAMTAATKYAVRGKVFFDTNATADFKWRHVGPGSPALMRIRRNWIVPGATAIAGIAVDVAFSAADLAVLTAATNGGWIEFEGIVHCGVAGGTFAFAWAQNTTNAGATIVRAGSYLEYMQL